MIQRQIDPAGAMRACHCTRAPAVVETRGRTLTDPRLIGLPARQYHVECGHCQRATAPTQAQAAAEHAWNHHRPSRLFATKALPELRARIERAQLRAAFR